MKRVAIFAFAATLSTMSGAHAGTCGNGPAGFEAWKREFAQDAAAHGAGPAAIAALMQTHYNQATISADRGQKSFRLSLEEFMAKRGGAAIVAQGRRLKSTQASLFETIERRYGVPPGPLLAIWGMETGFGRVRGKQSALSAVATLAYDCRRPAFFTEQLNAALKLVDRGMFSAQTRGSMHGEVGHTQFLPKNILLYGGEGSLEDSSHALMATANFLKAQGWRAGAGYQPGEPNFAALQAWNAASVYQRAIAIIGRQIDEGTRAAAY